MACRDVQAGGGGLADGGGVGGVRGVVELAEVRADAERRDEAVLRGPVEHLSRGGRMAGGEAGGARGGDGTGSHFPDCSGGRRRVAAAGGGGRVRVDAWMWVRDIEVEVRPRGAPPSSPPVGH